MDFINRFASIFGLKGISDDSSFSKYSVTTYCLRKSVLDLIPELLLYLKKYKVKYLELDSNVIFHRLLTILKYLLRGLPYALYKVEVIRNNKKINYYRILNCEENCNLGLEGLVCKENGICIRHNVVLHFDF
jgi:hypothetical protein